MPNLFLDSDVLQFLGTIFLWVILIIINKKIFKLRTNWRTYLGCFIAAMGLSGMIIMFFMLDFGGIMAGLVLVFIGTTIWLIRQKKAPALKQ